MSGPHSAREEAGPRRLLLIQHRRVSSDRASTRLDPVGLSPMVFGPPSRLSGSPRLTSAQGLTQGIQCTRPLGESSPLGPALVHPAAVVRDTTSSPLCPGSSHSRSRQKESWLISTPRVSAGPSWAQEVTSSWAALGQECLPGLTTGPFPPQREVPCPLPLFFPLTLFQFLPGLPADTLQGHRDRFLEQFTK